MKLRLRSVLALALAILMAVSVFAGCGSAKTTAEGTTTVSPAPSAAASGTEATAPAANNTKAVELSISTWNLQEFDPSKDEVAKYIKDKFNVTLKPIDLSATDALKLAASSNSLPDVFDFGMLYDPATYGDWIRQGIVRDIPDAMIAKYPNVKKLFDTDKTELAEKKLFGKSYSIIRVSSIFDNSYKVDWGGMYYRKDWAQNLGITVPEDTMTFDQYYQMLKAYTFNDPDKNGKKDTYGLTTASGIWLLSGWFPAFGTKIDSWIQEDGKWIPGFMSTKNIEPLKYIQKLYSEGLMDTEFASNDDNKAMQKFAGKIFGSIAKNSDGWWCYNVISRNFGAANKDIKDPYEVVGLLPPFKKDENSQPALAATIVADGTMFRAGLEDEKLDRYLAVDDWLLGDEARYLMNLGYEGKQYTKDASGKVVTFNDPATGQPYDIKKLYPATGLLGSAGWFLDLNFDPNWPLGTIPPKCMDLVKKVQAERNKYPFQTSVEASMVSTPAKDKLTIDAGNEFAQLVMSKENMDTQFANFIKKCNGLGADTAITEMNAEAQKLGIK